MPNPDHTDTPAAKAFREKYGSNKKSHSRFNAAIRAEEPGGEILLDLLELVHTARWQLLRGFSPKRPEAILEDIEDHIQAIRDELEAVIKARHNL